LVVSHVSIVAGPVGARHRCGRSWVPLA